MSHFDSSMLTSFRNALSLTTENSRMSLAIKIPMVCVALLPADLKTTKSCLDPFAHSSGDNCSLSYDANVNSGACKRSVFFILSKLYTVICQEYLFY